LTIPELEAANEKYMELDERFNAETEGMKVKMASLVGK
jgi:hypothetical protein